MPTYEYKCTECGFVFEEFQSIVSAPLEICPQCQGKIVRVIAGGAGLIFKGSGFYLTDYKNKHSSNTSDQSTDKKDSATKASQSEK